jgi:hypothetical protein
LQHTNTCDLCCVLRAIRFYWFSDILAIIEVFIWLAVNYWIAIQDWAARKNAFVFRSKAEGNKYNT